jgi:hypothetical protein
MFFKNEEVRVRNEAIISIFMTVKNCKLRLDCLETGPLPRKGRQKMGQQINHFPGALLIVA